MKYLKSILFALAALCVAASASAQQYTGVVSTILTNPGGGALSTVATFTGLASSPCGGSVAAIYVDEAFSTAPLIADMKAKLAWSKVSLNTVSVWLTNVSGNCKLTAIQVNVS